MEVPEQKGSGSRSSESGKRGPRAKGHKARARCPSRSPGSPAVPQSTRCAAQLGSCWSFSSKIGTSRLGGAGDRTHPPWPGPRGADTREGPCSAPGSDNPSAPLLYSHPLPHTRLSESLSLCSRHVSDTLSHYPPEGGGEPGPRSLITAELVSSRGGRGIGV